MPACDSPSFPRQSGRCSRKAWSPHQRQGLSAGCRQDAEAGGYGGQSLLVHRRDEDADPLFDEGNAALVDPSVIQQSGNEAIRKVGGLAEKRNQFLMLN